ncbi:MAG: Unknown protein [uncultured Sulfurovum sp.]|uniref:Uncharacterized protein n=1 Tax=uncultured Sulfurovum sp. TaxID=269237 RepID=A0A6S6U9K5_9BACT|nr:MAG: Unknown protein [uncultured Sulfurovum sp.]
MYFLTEIHQKYLWINICKLIEKKDEFIESLMRVSIKFKIILDKLT